MKKFTLLFFCFVSFPIIAQWTNDYNTNTLVSDSPTEDIQSIGTADGKTYVIYWDETSGYTLKVQLLDTEGNQIFGTEGIVVNDIADMSTWTATRDQAIDENGNLYVAFTATGSGKGHVNIISPEGVHLIETNAIEIDDAFDMKVLPAKNNNTIVGWYNNGKGNLMLYNQNGIALWDAPIEITSPQSGSSFTSIGELAAMSDGSFIAFFHTRGLSWNPNSTLWAQRYDMSGTAMWEEPIQISNQTTMFNRRYSLIEDEDVVYLGYYGSSGNRFDSFLQRINPDGTLPWGINGVDFSTDNSFYEMNTSIAFGQNSSYIWSSAQICNTNQSAFGQSVQKFDKETGERQLSDNAKEIFPLSTDYIQVGDLQLVNDQPLFLFSNGISNGTNSIQLGVTYLNENGDFVWDDEYILIATTQQNKGRFSFTKNVNNQSVAVWSENRNGMSKAYAQNFVIEENANVNTIIKSTITVYPNPVSDIINISSEKDIISIKVYNIKGQMINEFENTKQINISSLPQGIYILKTLSSDKESSSIKIVKK